MRRGRAWKGPVLRALQATTATLWGDAALHAFTVQPKAQAELEKMPLVCVDVGHSGVCFLLSGGVPCLTPLPCLSGEADFLLALTSQRAGIPLKNSGKDVICCYE